MNIGLIDVDSHNFPNLALMKLSAYHKSKGDQVEWWNGLKHYDRVYQSKVFDNTYSKDFEWVVNADEIIKGGTGYDLKNVLPEDIEHIYPDYTLYSGGGYYFIRIPHKGLFSPLPVLHRKRKRREHAHRCRA